MNHRFISVALLLLSLLGILTGYLILWLPSSIGLCSAINPQCVGEYLRYGIAKPLFWGTQLLPLLFLALFFVKKEIFFSWLKFIWWIAIIPIVLVIAAPPIGGLLPDRTLVTERMVQFLVLVSALFIIWRYWRLSKKKS